MRFFKSTHPARQSAAWCLFAMLAALSSVAWGAVGYVHEASGDVRVQNGAGTPKPVKPGDTFDPGVTFQTENNGHAVIKFEDGQLTSLQPNTRFRVDQYSFSPNNPKAGISAVRLVQGAMRFVTGLIGSTNRNNVRIAAGTTATIGIRGSDITLLVSAAGAVQSASVVHGGLALQTPAGTINVGPGQFFVCPCRSAARAGSAACSCAGGGSGSGQ